MITACRSVCAELSAFLKGVGLMKVNEKIQEIIKSEEVLFAYLKDTIYHPEQAQLELDGVEEHLQRLGRELQFSYQ